MSNSLIDLHTMLMDQIRRLKDPKLSNDDLLLEARRSAAMQKVGETVIKNAHLVLDASRMAKNADVNSKVFGTSKESTTKLENSTKLLKGEKKERMCLRCKELFISEHSGHRICDTCKKKDPGTSGIEHTLGH